MLKKPYKPPSYRTGKIPLWSNRIINREFDLPVRKIKFCAICATPVEDGPFRLCKFHIQEESKRFYERSRLFLACS